MVIRKFKETDELEKYQQMITLWTRITCTEY